MGRPRVGFVVLSRATQDDWIFRDGQRFCLWLWLLWNANWETGAHPLERQGKPLERGEVATSLAEIAHDLRTNESKVRRMLDRLKSKRYIDMRSDNHGRIIKIVDYCKTQDVGNKSDKQKDKQTPEEPAGKRHGNRQENGQHKEPENQENHETPQPPDARAGAGGGGADDDSLFDGMALRLIEAASAGGDWPERLSPEDASAMRRLYGTADNFHAAVVAMKKQARSNPKRYVQVGIKRVLKESLQRPAEPLCKAVYIEGFSDDLVDDHGADDAMNS